MRSQLMMGKRRRVRARLGLPRPAHRAAGREAAGQQGQAGRRASSAQRCEAHALKFVDVMRTEFKRLGCVGLWDTPYLTLSKDYEATIVAPAGRVRAGRAALPGQEAGALVRRPTDGAGRGRGRIRRAHLAVDLCALPASVPGQAPVERCCGKTPAALVIWTTTPWTLAANLAVVANPELDYVGHPGRRDGRGVPDRRGRAGPRAFLAATGIDAPPPATWIPISARPGCGRWKGIALPAPVHRPRRRRRARLPPVLRPPRHAGGRHRPGAHRARATAPRTTSSAASEGLRDLRARSTPRGRYTAEVAATGRA